MICLTGLPRSGSTLLCNLLAQHPEICSTASSPLSHILINMRQTWSTDLFLRAQLDHDYKRIEESLINGARGFIEGYHKNKNSSNVVDKNRSWLAQYEFVQTVAPKTKFIITIRDLRNIWWSVEKQHRKTQILSFPDETNPNNTQVRLAQLFSPTGVIGSALTNINNIKYSDYTENTIYVWRYEDFIANPQLEMTKLFTWLNLDDFKFEKVKQITNESDGFYNFKYPHKVQECNISEINPKQEVIFGDIADKIRADYDWFWNSFYSEQNKNETS